MVIGVHSGKYIAERETPRIREATLRLEIEHPVVNDRQFRVWRAYAIRAWPSLAVIDRNGYVVGSHAGEFTVRMLEPLLDALVSMSAENAVGETAHYEPDKPAIPPVTLRYPGKVAVDGSRIAIADTGNHRVLIGSLGADATMKVELTVTDVRSSQGPRSGRALKAPQGLVFSGDTLYVADSEAHTVSAVDLRDGTAAIVAGTGTQMRTRADRDAGALSSPWDVVVVGRTLYIAMAGIHQIWALDLDTRLTRVHSGSGGEDIVDGSHSTALLAQPMGMATDGIRLYFADAESSAVRWADTAVDGKVGTIVGTGLFDFGDVDGIGDDVRMQHQQGVAMHASGELLVADSYNNSLKWLNPETREARTWLSGFHEPGGVAAGVTHAYVADTNAHRIMVAEYATGNLRELRISS